MSNVLRDFGQVLMDLSALKTRTEDAARSMEKASQKMDTIIERITKLEVQYEYLSRNVRNEILAEVKSEMASLKTALDYEREKALSRLDSLVGSDQRLSIGSNTPSPPQ